MQSMATKRCRAILNAIQKVKDIAEFENILVIGLDVLKNRVETRIKQFENIEMEDE